MYTCIYAYILKCEYTYTCIHIHMYVYTYTHTHIYIYIYIYTYSYIYIMCICTYTCIYLNIYVHVYIHISINIYVCIYINMYVYIYTHTYAAGDVRCGMLMEVLKVWCKYIKCVQDGELGTGGRNRPVRREVRGFWGRATLLPILAPSQAVTSVISEPVCLCHSCKGRVSSACRVWFCRITRHQR